MSQKNYQKNKVEIEYFSSFLQAGIVFQQIPGKYSTQYVSIKLHKVTLTTAHFYVTTAQFVINCTLQYALEHRSLDVPFLFIRTRWYYCARPGHFLMRSDAQNVQ